MRHFFRVFVGLWVATCVVTAGFAYREVRAERARIVDALHRRAVVAAEALADAVEPLLERESAGGFARLLRRFTGLERRIAVFDGTGQVRTASPDLRSSLDALAGPLREVLEGRGAVARALSLGTRTVWLHLQPVGSPAAPAAVAAVVLDADDLGVWVAHGSGNADRAVGERVPLPTGSPAYTLRRVWLDEAEEAGYYYGFANEGLWPLCHIVHVRPQFRLGDFQQYRAVNQKFANTLLEEMETAKAPLVLVQDYHFALLPEMVKRVRPDALIALFWHIPWPNFEASRRASTGTASPSRAGAAPRTCSPSRSAWRPTTRPPPSSRRRPRPRAAGRAARETLRRGEHGRGHPARRGDGAGRGARAHATHAALDPRAQHRPVDGPDALAARGAAAGRAGHAQLGRPPGNTSFPASASQWGQAACYRTGPEPNAPRGPSGPAAMHEMSVAQSILDVVREYVPDDQAAAVTAVRVRVGTLSGVVPESLDFCFGALVAGTPLGRARLDLERVAAECACGACGARFAPAGGVFRCPACGAGDTRLVSGADLHIVSVEVAESGIPAP